MVARADEVTQFAAQADVMRHIVSEHSGCNPLDAAGMGIACIGMPQRAATTETQMDKNTLTFSSIGNEITMRIDWRMLGIRDRLNLWHAISTECGLFNGLSAEAMKQLNANHAAYWK